MQDSRRVTSHSTEVVDGKRRIKALSPFVYHIPLQSKRERKQYDNMVRRLFADYD
jgi:hypothetical protein